MNSISALQAIVNGDLTESYILTKMPNFGMPIQEEIEQLGAGPFRLILSEDSNTLDGSPIVEVVIEQLTLGGALRAEGQDPDDPSVNYRLRNDE